MSFDFTTLVTDRTQSDVQRVRSVAAKIINGTASAAEIAEWNAANMKGAYNYTDLNRVTAAIEALKSTLDGYGYSVPGYKRIEIPRGDGARLPEGHTELKWIESSGTQVIDSGVVGSNTIGFECEFETSTPVASSGQGTIFGCLNSTSARYEITTWTNSSAKGQFCFGAKQYDPGITVNKPIALSLRNGIFTTPSGAVSVDTTAFNSGANIALFGRYRSGYGFDEFSKTRIPYFRLYDGDTLIRDYVPDLTDDGQVGLYDLVEGKFYPNAGTGAFIAGPVVEQAPATGGNDKDPYLWYETDIPTPDLMAAYLANVSAIRSVLDMLPTTPAVPADMEQLTTYRANAIERILTDINTLIHNMIAAWFYSGEIYSGEV